MSFTEMVRAADDDELYLLLTAVNEEIAWRRFAELPRRVLGLLRSSTFADNGQRINMAEVREVRFASRDYEDGRFFAVNTMLITFTEGNGDDAEFEDFDVSETAVESMHSLLHEITRVIRDRQGVTSITGDSVLLIDAVNNTAALTAVKY